MSAPFGGQAVQQFSRQAVRVLFTGVLLLGMITLPLFPFPVQTFGGQLADRGLARAVDHRAVTDALQGWDLSFGSLFFFNPSKTSNQFVWAREVTTTIGSHRFMR
ncbi:MAG: cell wall hydrolase [Thermaerobacterales bacterium]